MGQVDGCRFSGRQNLEEKVAGHVVAGKGPWPQRSAINSYTAPPGAWDTYRPHYHER